MKNTFNLAYFISPHGFGHAARASAVMNALHAAHRDFYFHIFTSVPEWFFKDSLNGQFKFHELVTDVGLIQSSSLSEDIPKTLDRLHHFYPLPIQFCGQLALEINALDCQAILCDIAPLGIEIAENAGLPSFLIENFTWDWIYEGYLNISKEFEPLIQILAKIFKKATFHIQAIPVCNPDSLASLSVSPISRAPRTPRKLIHHKMHISDTQKMVLITMGGVKEELSLLGAFKNYPRFVFVIPGSSDTIKISGNTIHLPYHSNFYHPDLVYAADAVIGKAGYSTVSETYHARKPFGFVNREHFREAPIIEDFIINEMNGIPLSQEDFHSGKWLLSLDSIINTSPLKHEATNGAQLIAEFVINSL